ncbi:MAG: RluA family pseudouridine synthase [Clostridiales bacterium]|nr:RluA family pseudouridine synthase [Clostridiales bacterium]
MTDFSRRRIEYKIPTEYDEKKVIAYLRGEAKLSSRLIRTLKHYEDGILLNGIHARTVDLLKTGDTLSVTLPDSKNEIEPLEYELDVIYEDEDLLIINKPALLPMHPTHNHQGDTLANAVVNHLINEGKQPSFKAVGRLDKGTGGLVVCALNSHCAARLQAKIRKTYYAVADGVYEGCGTIDRPIYRPDPLKTLRAVGESGDRAITHWKALKTDGKRTLLEIELETGRTHQIRVHFASLGTPLTGDRMYGKKSEEIPHQALFCGKISFTHPVTGTKMKLECPIPDEMNNLL